jgi:hypothetical protein
MHVAKWGNSLAVRLPRALVDELRLKAGDEVEVVDATRERLAVARTSAARRRSDGWRRCGSRFRPITGSIESKPSGDRRVRG